MKKTIEELEKEVEQIKADLEELKQNRQVEWKPKENDCYWSVDLDAMKVFQTTWTNDDRDNTRLNHKVVFRTQKEAEEWLDYLKAKEKAMSEFNRKEWEDCKIDKFIINYEYDDEKIAVNVNWLYQIYNTPYFRTKKEAKVFIDKYEKQIKRDMGICEEN